MTITIPEFKQSLIAARTLDEYRWTRLKMAEALLEQFCFDDNGATYIEHSEKTPA